MRVSTSYNPGGEWAKIGDYRVPKAYKVIVEAEDEPTIELEVEIVDGRAVCMAFTVRKREPIVQRDIRQPIERYLGILPAFGAFKATGTGESGRDRLSLVSGEDAAELLGEVQGRRRRSLTDEFLRRVADAYKAAGGHVRGITADDDPDFHASESQKFRWIKAARDRGFLPDRDGD